MPRFGLVGPSYEAQSPNLDAQAAINWYVEQDESGAGNAPIALMPTPGIQSFVDLNPPEPPPPPPPPPPPTFPPAVVVANQYNWNLAGGMNVGFGRQNVPVVTSAIEVGDVLFLLFAGTVSNPPNIYNPILSVTAPMMTGVAFSQLGPTFNMGFSNAGNRFFQVFYARATSAVAAGVLLINFTLLADPQNNVDMAGSIMLIRNITTLDQLSTLMDSTVTVAPPITISGPRFLATFIGSAEALVTIPDPPYRKLTAGISNLAGIAIYRVVGPPEVDIAPAGSYSPPWTQVAGPFNVAVVTAAFFIT